MSDQMNENDPIEIMAQSVPQIKELNPEALAALKQQIKQEMLEEFKQESQIKSAIRQENIQKMTKDYQDFIDKMKLSTEPWVDVQGWVETEKGVEMKLDWNDAFVKFLRDNGINGTSDDQVVHKYVTLLLRDMADQLSDKDDSTESEFE